LHGELQSFSVEGAGNGAANALSQLPHVVDFGREEVGK
jgi:hypothetical protein